MTRLIGRALGPQQPRQPSRRTGERAPSVLMLVGYRRGEPLPRREYCKLYPAHQLIEEARPMLESDGADEVRFLDSQNRLYATAFRLQSGVITLRPR